MNPENVGTVQVPKLTPAMVSAVRAAMKTCRAESLAAFIAAITDNAEQVEPAQNAPPLRPQQPRQLSAQRTWPQAPPTRNLPGAAWEDGYAWVPKKDPR